MRELHRYRSAHSGRSVPLPADGSMLRDLGSVPAPGRTVPHFARGSLHLASARAGRRCVHPHDHGGSPVRSRSGVVGGSAVRGPAVVGDTRRVSGAGGPRRGWPCGRPARRRRGGRSAPFRLRVAPARLHRATQPARRRLQPPRSRRGGRRPGRRRALRGRARSGGSVVLRARYHSGAALRGPRRSPPRVRSRTARGRGAPERGGRRLRCRRRRRSHHLWP